MTNQLYILILILAILPLSSTAQLADNGQIKGVVTFKGKGSGMAEIRVVGTQLATTSKEDGTFEISSVPFGIYQIQAKMGFYQMTARDILVSPGEDLYLELEMEADLLQLEQVVVTASRREQSRRDAVVIVNVTDSKIFEATQSLSMAEGLGFQPGLRLETNCQNCGFSQVRINGMDGAYSQILIDGRPIFSALNGIYGLEQIPANMIDRIEVVRGGGSALYGANAIAGTINVITRDPMENHYQLSLQGGLINGSNPDGSLSVNTTLVSEDLKQGLSVFGMLRNRQAYDHNGDGFTEMPTMQNQTLGFKTFYKPTLTRRYAAEFHATREYRRGGDQLLQPPHEAEIAEELNTRMTGGGLTFEQYSQDLNKKVSAYISGQFTEMANYYGGGQDLNGYGRTTDQNIVTGIQYTQSVEGLRPFTLTFGSEYKWNRMMDSKPGYGLFVNQDLTLFSLYTQADWQLTDRIKVLAGLRLDDNNLNEKALFNPRFSTLIDLREKLQFRGSYARGFRAPQVFSEDIHVELVAGGIQAIRLGDHLRSETSDSYTLSLDLTQNWGSFQTNWTLEGFYTRLNSPFILVELPAESGGVPILEKRNGGGATVKGGHLESKWALGRQWSMQSSLTLQNSQYDEAVAWSNEGQAHLDTRTFLRAPNVYGQFVLRWQASDHWFISASGLYTGSMLVPHFAGYITNDRLEQTRDFWELNLKASYTFDIWEGMHLRVQSGVQNLFNQFQTDFDLGANRDASYIYGPSRPRTYFLGLSLERAHE